VRAVFRRLEKASQEPDILRSADIVVDKVGRGVLVNGHPVPLTPSEFDLLAVLISAPGRVFSRLELLDRLQGTAYEGYERTIDVHIRNLRTKIEPDASNPRYIETVYGAGYRFSAEG
jgi:DNA-binding response OmpR family regulator